MKLAALGEVMVELAPQASEKGAQSGGAGRPLLAQSYAGDTYNTAVYIARGGVDVSYVTLLGDDPYSEEVLTRLAGEGIDTSAIVRLPGRCPGLYMIQNTADGERYFTYWRGEAPARELFTDVDRREQLKAHLRQMDCLYLSGITLAIMTSEARAELLAFLGEYRANGGRVAFDSNYRPRLWRSVEAARTAVAEFMAVTDMALLTFEDEQALWGDTDTEQCVQRNTAAGVAELVIKRGAEPVLLQYRSERSEVEVPAVSSVLDTTGAGDSFNAGYLAARLQGASPEQSIVAGNRCAARVIGHRGAIIPRADYFSASAAGGPGEAVAQG
ncbi:sugar kinase [Microbulbifer bruguierae]|uniref:Sugar kinase n=1 Tax=Microbulbifer bruguierae TaxID=3029061 RepID=A0ABY8NAS7_9GAMM|nr:sugar kinase [Microbulbifer bruguierae]WGL15775.1 sugar kinase [Microbulbifer bruguierae]